MRKDTEATRKRIIDEAEKLFAERGVDNTSLLDIAKAAQQKNRSALQYHFTNKQGLLDAVLDKHAKGIAEHRSAMLDQLEAGGEFSLYQLIEVLVLPLASRLDKEDGGHAFLKIHSQLMTSESYRELRSRRDRDAPDIKRLENLMAQHTNTRDQRLIQARMMLMGVFLIHGLANYIALSDSIPRSVFIHTLIQAIVDLLQQPSSQ
ncbi:MAG: helix-turn-helix domain-containing protein [Pseudomonadales bacterium]